MNPLTYTISTNGIGIAIGISGDKQQAQQDAILAENLYGCNHSDHLFDFLLYMPSIESFKKFLILKEYFKIWDEHFTRNRVSGSRAAGNVMQFTRRAIRRAYLILDNVRYENFMQAYSARNQSYQIGGYQDEQEQD